MLHPSCKVGRKPASNDFRGSITLSQSSEKIHTIDSLDNQSGVFQEVILLSNPIQSAERRIAQGTLPKPF